MIDPALHPEEYEQSQADKAHAKILFTPEFIPFYMDVQKQYGLSMIETLLYGFVRFFLNNSGKKFFFSDEQISEILNCSMKTTSKAIKKLRDEGIIQTSYRMRAGGGRVRFVSFTECNYQPKGYSTTTSSRGTLYKKNNIKEDKSLTAENGDKSPKNSSTAEKKKFRTFKKESKQYSLSEFFNRLLVDQVGTTPVKPNLQVWANDIDHIFRNVTVKGEPISENTLKTIIQFALTESWWKKNIADPSDLKRYWTKIIQDYKSSK